MRSNSLVSRFFPLLALMTASGCNTAYRQAMAAADEAIARGDFLTAARAYRDACKASPDDEKACSQAPIFAQKATDQALESARPACGAGDLDRCIPPLLAARDLLPDHPEVNGLLTQASQLHTERCTTQWKDENTLSIAVSRLACLQARAAQFPVPGYQNNLTETANRISSRFAQLAATAQSQGSAGAASVLWSTAQCLAPSQDGATRVQQAQQSFLDQSAIPVVARIGGTVPPRVAAGLENLCDSLSRSWPAVVRCASPNPVAGQPDPLQVQVDALIERSVENVLEDVRDVRYVSGTRQVYNPGFREARKRLAQAEDAVRMTDQRKRNKDKECAGGAAAHDATCVDCPEGKKKKSPCDEAKDLTEELKRRVQEANAARDNLAHTPEMVSEDVYDNFRYSVLTHRWASGFRFTLQSNTPGVAPYAQQSGMLSFEDQEHVGFSPAGIEADPLVVPPPQAYADAFLQQLAPHVFTVIKKDSEVRAAARRAQCAALPADWSTSWVQCWAEASLWGNGEQPQPAEFLRTLASSAGASDQPNCR